MTASRPLADSSAIRALSLPRRSLRGIRTAAHVARGLFVPKETGIARHDPLSLWCRDLLSVMGVTINVVGDLPQSGAFLLVSNHISWMDILVIRALFPARFVAKEEIALWPLIGGSAREAGTLFIARNRLSSFYRTLLIAHSLLEQNLSICLFPEGTTTTGDRLLPFRTGMFQVSVTAQKPVLPLCLSYATDTSQSAFSVTFTGGETFARSFWRTMGEPRLTAVVDCHAPIFPEGMTRKELARKAWSAIRNKPRA